MEGKFKRDCSSVISFDVRVTCAYMTSSHTKLVTSLKLEMVYGFESGGQDINALYFLFPSTELKFWLVINFLL